VTKRTILRSLTAKAAFRIGRKAICEGLDVSPATADSYLAGVVPCESAFDWLIENAAFEVSNSDHVENKEGEHE
jgi:hypothetical protein